MSQGNRAVILARVSSKSQEDEGYSLDSQVKLLRSYCENKALLVAETFKIAESASKASQRRTFKEAMKYIENNKIKNLIIEKVDRHVRNLHDAVETHDWLVADENKQVHFVKDTLVLHKNSRSQEWLNWGIRVVMAKNYIDNLREESMKGMMEKLAQGWLPAPPPPGYMSATQSGKRIHVPNPDTRYSMLKVFKKYLEPGETIRTVAFEMERLGVRARSGRFYSKSQVQKILTNPFYIGINRFDGKEYPGVQEQIIPKEIFERVQEKMHQGRPRTYAKHDAILKGMILCADCDSLVTWQLQKGRYYGVCRRRNEACKKGKMLREDQVEKAIQNMLKDLVCPSQEIIEWAANTMRERQRENIEERERLTKSVKTQIDRIGRMDDMLYDDKLSGYITKDKYEAKHEQFAKEKLELAERLENIDVSMGRRLEQRVVLLELSQKAAQIYARKPQEQKRLIISKLFDQLTLKEGRLSVSYSKFARAIAEKVEKTRNLMEDQK